MSVTAATFTEQTILDDVGVEEYRLLQKNDKVILVCTDGDSYWDIRPEFTNDDPETGEKADLDALAEILLELFTGE